MAPLWKRIALLPTALLALCLSSASAAANSTLTPVSFVPDENWDGIDGAWSTFTLRVGTPQQFVRTFVSFNSYQTWVVLPQGCDAAADRNSCAQTRGWLFNQTASSTFDRVGIYDLYTESNLGYRGNAIYGYDTVGLGGIGENGPTVMNTTVGGLAVDDFYLGVFGVNPKPTNFTNFNEPSPSYMTLLKQQNRIPSISAAYTAGAKYRFTGVLASLTLGGYDASKFVPNNVSFSFAADNDRNTIVALQSVSTPSRTTSSPVGTELLANPIYVFIDSTVAQIWLPVAACQAFEQEFGLVYDNATELYLVNDTLHQALTTRNPNVTFSLGQALTGGGTVQITLPYAAFDLTAQTPYQGLANQTRYFPLRRAANDTQYTLGRTFLQEAYLSVNWEAATFNVSQCAWTQNAATNLVTIPPGGVYESILTSGSQGASSSHSLGGGAIAGIVIGALVGVALLAGLAFWLMRRRRRNAREVAHDEKLAGDDDSSDPVGLQPNVFAKAELEGSMPPPPSHPSDSQYLLSGPGSTVGGSSTPHTPTVSSGIFYPSASSSNSPTTPSGGEGTYMSNHSGSHYGSGVGGSSRPQSSLLRTPISPASEADSRERHIYEMAGDMPTIKEKDGKSLSEKEALAHRERIYNGVDSPPHSATAVNEAARGPRRVSPEEVVLADAGAGIGPGDLDLEPTRHRAFSFEQSRGGAGMKNSDELYE